METSNVKIWLIVIGIIASQLVFSQNVSISEDDSYTPDASAMLDVYSQDKGLLVPRLTTAERTAIGSPATGLLVYDTTIGVFYYYNGTGWAKVGSASYSYENGLTESTNIVKLGGSLTGNTTISQGTYNMIFNLTSTGDFNIQDNGTSAFFVQDDGNVGIGINSPYFKTDIVGGSGTILRLRANTTTSGSQARLNFSITTNNNASQAYSSYIAGERTVSSQDLVFGTASPNSGTPAERMRIVGTGAVGLGTSTPDASALLDITSTDKGVLIPRMSKNQRVAISNPANGLLVFDTDYNCFFYYYNDGVDKAGWTNLSSYGPASSSEFDEALFAVVNTLGDTVFAVYQEGVQINVGDGTSKGNAKGGFAVSGVTSGKGITNEILRVTEDSVRIYFNMDVAKGNAKGGFAVSGVTSGKGVEQNYFLINQDSARIYVEEGLSGGKGNAKGGFAVSGVTSGKGISNDIMKITKDSTRLYVADPNAGFSIGNTESGTSESLMKLTKENYFIGHESGIKNFLGLGDNGRYNSFIGYQAGKLATTGYRNVLLGYQSGLSLNQGFDNIFIGYKSGCNVTNAFNNVFIGTNVGANSTGSSNIFVGDSVGYGNLSGFDNVFIGYATGKANIDGHHNVFIGSNSAKTNTSGYDNVMIGANAGFKNTSGASNVLIGDRVGYLNTTGSFNVILGNLAGYNNTSGERNIFIGYLSGYKASTESRNIFIGDSVGYNDTNGGNNVFMGVSAGFSNTNGDENIFIGNRAGYKNTIGNYNTFIGFEAGYKNIGSTNPNGSYNSFYGYKAGRSNTNGYYNTFMGFETGLTNNTGHHNSFYGYQAGHDNTSGSYNNFYGYMSGYKNTYGTNNAFYGPYSGYENTGGEFNAFFGPYAGYGNTTGSGNTFLGYYSGYSNSTGDYNFFAGYESGKSNTTGDGNIFLGYMAGQLNSTGNYNSMIGYNSGKVNTTGHSNTFLGYGSGGLNTTGTQNLYLGSYAGQVNSTGSDNTIVGFGAGAYAQGNNNTFFGSYAGYGSNNDNGNVFIGYKVGYTDMGSNKLMIDNDNVTSSTALIYGEFDNNLLRCNGEFVINTSKSTNANGYGINATISKSGSYYNNVYGANFEATDAQTATISHRNCYGIRTSASTSSTNGSSSAFGIYATVAGNADNGYAGYFSGDLAYTGTLTDVSDIKFKQNIVPVYNALERILKLNPVTYTYDTESYQAFGLPKGQRFGLIAQELQTIFPEFVSKQIHPGYEGDEEGKGKSEPVEYLGVNYIDIIPVLIQSTKEQQEIINQQKTEIEFLKNEVYRIQEIEKQLLELKGLVKNK